jgi:acetyl-CoA C-acetyltransferase
LTPLTSTGGLSCAGGPWNNYSTHAIATMADRLRGNRNVIGLITANSGYLTKHAVGIYSTRPPTGGFYRRDAQQYVDAQPTTAALTSYIGPATVEAATVSYGRDGRPDRGFVAARTPRGERVLATSSTPDDLARVLETDPTYAAAAVHDDGTFHFK